MACGATGSALSSSSWRSCASTSTGSCSSGALTPSQANRTTRCTRRPSWWACRTTRVSVTRCRWRARSVVSVARFWRLLDEVDTVWVLGPYPHSVLLALMTICAGGGWCWACARTCRCMSAAADRTGAGCTGARTCSRGSGDCSRAATRSSSSAPSWSASTATARRAVCSRRPSRSSPSAIVDAAGEAVAARDYAGELTLLTVGRLETEKNPLLLADDAGPPAPERTQLAPAGLRRGPDARASCSERLRELGVHDRAELLGYVPIDGGLLDLYRSSHAFLHVSWTEGFPQVLVRGVRVGPAGGRDRRRRRAGGRRGRGAAGRAGRRRRRGRGIGADRRRRAAARAS